MNYNDVILQSTTNKTFTTLYISTQLGLSTVSPF